MTLSRGSRQQADWQNDPVRKDATKAAIRAALVEMFDNHSEVPYIAFFCKEVG